MKFKAEGVQFKLVPTCPWSVGWLVTDLSVQEYTEEFRDIAKGKSKESLPTGPITLLNQRPVSEDVRFIIYTRAQKEN